MNDFGLKEKVVSFIVDAARSCGLTEVILFGSRATGRYHDKSDIDLAVSGGDINGFIGEIEERCPTLLTFDFVDLSRDISDALKRRISDEGIRIYG